MNFALILFLLTVATGLVWALDRFVLARRRAADAPVPAWIEYPVSFFPVLLVVFLLRSFVAEPFKIPSSSMRPTLEVGDFILVNKFAYGLRLPILEKKVVPTGDPRRGDVIVFRYPVNPSQDFIKRVVGLPGDTVEYRDKKLTVNGKPVQRVSDGNYSWLEGLRFETTDRFVERADAGPAPHDYTVAVSANAPTVYPQNVRTFPGRELCDYNNDGLHLPRAARPLLHDGRQPRFLGRQPLLGLRAGRSHPRQGVLHLVQLGRHLEPRVQARRERDPMRGGAMTASKRAQGGLSMIGFLFVAVVIVVVAMVGFRIAPSYVEYFTIRSAIEKSLRDAPDPTAAVVKKSFEKYIAADYIDSVTAADLNVVKDGNTVTASLDWQKQLPLVGNVSLLLDFDVSVSR